MSKSFPLSARKCDVYVAFDSPMQIGQVFYVGTKRRLVIREAFSRDAWDAERAIPVDPGSVWSPGRYCGIVQGESFSQPAKSEPEVVTGEVPAQLTYFYGADYV